MFAVVQRHESPGGQHEFEVIVGNIGDSYTGLRAIKLLVTPRQLGSFRFVPILEIRFEDEIRT